MPVAILERIPLPSLQSYTLFSCSLFTCALYYAHQIVTDEGGGPVLNFVRFYLLGPLGLAHVGLEGMENNSTGDVLMTEAISNETDALPVPVQHPGEPVSNKTLDGSSYTNDLLSVLITETWCVWVSKQLVYLSCFLTYSCCLKQYIPKFDFRHCINLPTPDGCLPDNPNVSGSTLHYSHCFMIK